MRHDPVCRQADPLDDRQLSKGARETTHLRLTAAQAEPALSFGVSAGLVVVARPSNLLHR